MVEQCHLTHTFPAMLTCREQLEEIFFVSAGAEVQENYNVI